MVTLSVGTTVSGKVIKLLATYENDPHILGVFSGFSDHDCFDALLAIEYLILREKRRKYPQAEWVKSLRRQVSYLRAKLGPQRIGAIQKEAGLTTAFAARDHGKMRLYPHFRA